jgi:hypothetical protein
MLNSYGNQGPSIFAVVVSLSMAFIVGKPTSCDRKFLWAAKTFPLLLPYWLVDKYVLHLDRKEWMPNGMDEDVVYKRKRIYIFISFIHLLIKLTLGSTNSMVDLKLDCM